MNKKGPVRTCVSCKTRKAKNELVRFVAGLNGELLADVQFKLPGRGASVCFDLKCLKDFSKKNRASSALKNPKVSFEINELLDILIRSYERYFFNLLKVGFGGKKVIEGLENCINNIKKKSVCLNIIPSDIGKDSLQKIMNVVNSFNVKTIFIGTKESFSEMLNKPYRSVYCITDEQFANKLYDIYEKISILNDWMEQEVPCNG
jgi:predicted RNA-binding protein YlxR (DUF448 family)